MLTSALCPKCHHQLIEPCPKSSPFYPTAGHPLTQPDHVQPDCNNVVLNVEVSLKIELPKHCLNTLNSNVTVVSKALQCGGGIVLPTSENEDNSTDLDKYLENPSHVRSIESTYPIGFDENRRNFGRGAPEIRLNQSCAVTPNPTLPLNIPMGREICQRDLDTLTATVKVLRMSGFYYESISQQKALDLLTNKSPGTFLVRNSSNPQHIFAISVQTIKGPTSVRLNYLNGLFYFDCDDHLHDRIAKFPCVIQLIEHYIKHAAPSAPSGTSGKQQVWLDYFTRKYYSKILLVKPLRKEIPKLQQLCRSAIYKNNLYVSSHSIPHSLVTYLKQFPYAV
ncbi:suppressor of cytokine signaling 2-like [Diaphorina citri]|uniref:Suppressor of cytokine signaling 2-like n=1 Tax=Diaphorina citri TaxID=121845 RepID=A0A3Q0IJH3_DIACI|nr:suppressor of cytokine signaling 2-like [Diaphorina citri]